jgi:hypothetical protein
MADNPFTTQAKKHKLKSFKVAATKATPKKAEAKGIASPFTRLAKTGSADPRKEQLATLKDEIADVSKRLLDARKDEAKKFKTLDKLDMAKVKPKGNRYDDVRAEWSAAMTLLDRLNARLVGLTTARRLLEGEINGTILRPRARSKRR